MTEERQQKLRWLWCLDLANMRAGTYSAPLPHPNTVGTNDMHRAYATKTAEDKAGEGQTP